ncbi:MAG: VOC family protein [Steroidobacteraceae bacterium]
MPTVQAVPAGSQSITPYLIVRDAARALDFYARAFGAKELFRLTEPAGRIGHSELQLGGSTLMLADEYPDFGSLAPASLGGSPVKMHLRVDNVDGFMRRAVAAGATELRPAQDQMYGERSGMLADPFGHQWFVSTHIEDVSPEEMQKRFTAAMSASG